MDKFMNAAKIASKNPGDEQAYSVAVNCVRTDSNTRKEWAKTHWVDKIIRDFRTREFIGFILNDGSIYSAVGLTTVLLNESAGHITVRKNQELVFSVGMDKKEGSKYVALRRKASDKQLAMLDDIFVDGYNSEVTVGQPDGFVFNVD